MFFLGTKFFLRWSRLFHCPQRAEPSPRLKDARDLQRFHIPRDVGLSLAELLLVEIDQGPDRAVYPRDRW